MGRLTTDDSNTARTAKAIDRPTGYLGNPRNCRGASGYLGNPRTENLPSSKRIGPVKRFPLSKAGASDLISMMYEAVLSAVAVPPRRPDPKPPTAFSALRIFLKHHPNRMYSPP